MAALREYQTTFGASPYGRWYARLNAPAAAKVATALIRLGLGNTSNLKPLGEGVSEVRIKFGPGYRVYVGQDGQALVILLGGGTKQRQNQDIAVAKQRWRDYRRRK